MHRNSLYTFVDIIYIYSHVGLHEFTPDWLIISEDFLGVLGRNKKEMSSHLHQLLVSTALTNLDLLQVEYLTFIACLPQPVKIPEYSPECVYM